MQLADMAERVRSKNAGPFWISIDVFCGDRKRYDTIAKALDSKTVAAIYQIDASELLRFEIPSLNVLKFSFPRPMVQGSKEDRDMHGAQWSVLLAETNLT